MHAPNFTLNALNENARFGDNNQFTKLAALVDCRALLGTQNAPTKEEYLTKISDVINAFPELNLDAHQSDIFASAWNQLVVIFAKNFMAVTFAEKDTEKFNEFEAILSASPTVEKGLHIFNIPVESTNSFLLPCYARQSDVSLNNLEMTLAFNYGATEQIINQIHAFNADSSAVAFCGLLREEHSKVIQLIEKFARYVYDFIYDLLWGSESETKQDGAYHQRKSVLNTSNLYSLLN